MRAALLAAFSAMIALPAFAQQPGVPNPGAAAAQASGPEDVRVNQLIVYGDDPCPQAQDPNEVTVCARLPEDDRFRVPPNLREDPNSPANQSWANRAIELSYVGRSGIGSCSTAGPGGASGCFAQLVNQARAERRGADDVNWARMIEEARQARLSRIDEDARAAEEEEQRRTQPD
jgi:hypothetical protein